MRYRPRLVLIGLITALICGIMIYASFTPLLDLSPFRRAHRTQDRHSLDVRGYCPNSEPFVLIPLGNCLSLF